MSRKSNVARDKRREQRALRVWEARKSLKKIVKSFDASPEEKLKAQTKLEKNRDDSIVRVTNRCQMCTRPRATTRRVGLCRICFRQLAMRALIPGVRKSSW